MSEGNKHKKVWGKSIIRPEKDRKSVEDGGDQKNYGAQDDDSKIFTLPTEIKAVLQENISTIHSEFSTLRSDLKEDMSDFQQRIRDDIGNDLMIFFNRKLNEATKSLQLPSERVEEVEKRTVDLEEWGVNVRDVKIQEDMQAKLTDLKSRTRQNNIRIYGIPEGCEGRNVI